MWKLLIPIAPILTLILNLITLFKKVKIIPCPWDKTRCQSFSNGGLLSTIQTYCVQSFRLQWFDLAGNVLGRRFLNNEVIITDPWVEVTTRRGISSTKVFTSTRWESNQIPILLLTSLSLGLVGNTNLMWSLEVVDGHPVQDFKWSQSINTSTWWIMGLQASRKWNSVGNHWYYHTGRYLVDTIGTTYVGNTVYTLAVVLLLGTYYEGSRYSVSWLLISKLY